MRPVQTPIGLHLTQTARVVSRAFDDALAQVGGSAPVWLVLLNLKIRPQANQRELAEAIGVRQATLTYHLNAMEAEGLLSRRRDPVDRRVRRRTGRPRPSPCRHRPGRRPSLGRPRRNRPTARSRRRTPAAGPHGAETMS
jgi:DNA-binding transcriptional ArsR family regulator